MPQGSGEERKGPCKHLLLPECVPPGAPPSIRRAVLENAASASEERTPGHALMRVEGAAADRVIKLSEGAGLPGKPGAGCEQREATAGLSCLPVGGFGAET